MQIKIRKTTVLKYTISNKNRLDITIKPSEINELINKILNWPIFRNSPNNF